MHDGASASEEDSHKGNEDLAELDDDLPVVGILVVSVVEEAVLLFGEVIVENRSVLSQKVAGIKWDPKHPEQHSKHAKTECEIIVRALPTFFTELFDHVEIGVNADAAKCSFLRLT